MEPDAPVKIGHLVAAVNAGTLAPCEMAGEKPARQDLPNVKPLRGAP